MIKETWYIKNDNPRWFAKPVLDPVRKRQISLGFDEDDFLSLFEVQYHDSGPLLNLGTEIEEDDFLKNFQEINSTHSKFAELESLYNGFGKLEDEMGSIETFLSMMGMHRL